MKCLPRSLDPRVRATIEGFHCNECSVFTRKNMILYSKHYRKGQNRLKNPIQNFFNDFSLKKFILRNTIKGSNDFLRIYYNNRRVKYVRFFV